MRTRCALHQLQRIKLSRSPCRSNSTSIPSQAATGTPNVPNHDPLSSHGANPPLNDTRTHHMRRPNNRPLPLPPLMDPTRIAQRARHKQRKAHAPPPSHMTPFQQRLSANPYAALLASPMRNDHLTQSRLPAALLLPFDVKPSPAPPHAPHLLPSDLWSEADPAAPQDPMVRSPRTYVALRRRALSWLGEKRRRVRGVVNAAMVQRFGERLGESVVWRGDMAEVVLGLLRRGVERKVRWLLERGGKRAFEKVDGGAEDADGVENVACVLYVGSLTSEECKRVESEVRDGFREGERLAGQVRTAVEKRGAIERGKGKQEFNDWCRMNNFPPKINPMIMDPPADFPTVNLDGKVVPVYSLEDLMGKEETVKLLKGTIYEDARCWAMRDGQITASAQMWLLKLQAYLT